MYTTVAFAIELIDFQTGERIDHDVSITANNGYICPVQNLEGYFVFVNITVPQLVINITSKKYTDVQTYINLPTDKLMKITLVPKSTYSNNNKIFNLSPFEQVYVGNRNKVLRLGANISTGDTKIKIYVPYEIGLSRVTYVLYRKDGELGEKIYIDKRIEKGIYSLRNAVKFGYEKKDYGIIPLSMVFADETGLLSIPCDNNDENIFLT